MEAQRITFALRDDSAGFESGPERVRLGDLAGFASDVAVFLRGDGKEVDANAVEVAVKAGSFALETAPLAGVPLLFRDLRSLALSESLDGLDARRREVVEHWQKAARQNAGRAYSVSAPCLDRPVTVTAVTDYHADDADQWVQVERYIRGEIQDLGGSTKANAHVRLPDGRTLKVGTDRDLLRDDSVNRLYKPAMLRIRAEFNVLTRELRNALLIEFVEYAAKIDEDALAKMTRRGALAWKDVPDATAWVDGMRGGDH